MTKNQILCLITGIVIGFGLAYLLISNNSLPVTAMMMRNNTQSTSNTIDAHFIEQMIPHHEDAITMAKLALVRSQRPEIRQLSENIIKSQTSEINQMKSWYQDWFKRQLPSGDQVMTGHGMMQESSMHMGMMGSDADMSRLENATDFDKVFIEDMIPHHQMAVMMANMLERSTARAEMKQLAQDIINAQTSEIDQMRTWYTEWGY